VQLKNQIQKKLQTLKKTIMSTGKVVLGTMAGLAVGAILGVLFAPEKGSVTRKQIMDKGNDYVDDLKSKYNEFKDSITEQFESTKDDVNQLADRAKSKYDDVKKEVTAGTSNYKM
jgi:gas vesicle protein